MRTHTIKPALLAAVLLSLPLLPVIYADPAPADVLSLEKARSLALEKSAVIHKYTLAVDAAVLVKKAQDYTGLPSVSASGSAAYANSDSSSSGTTVTAGVSASQTVFDGGKNGALSKKYEYASQAARENLRSERISLIGTVDSAFFSVLEDQASLAASQSDLDAAKLRLQIAQVKTQTGALSRSDLLETESEIASYQAALDKSKSSLLSDKATLASYTGLAVSTRLAPVDFTSYDQLITKMGTLDETSLAAIVGTIVSKARLNSPVYSTYALAASEASQTLSAAKKACLPTVSASAAGQLSSGSDTTSTKASITLSAALDLDVLTLKNTIDQAQNALDQAKYDTTDQGETLDRSVAQAVYSWIAAALAIPSSQTALAYAKSNYETVLEKFKISSATSSDVSTAQALVSTDQTALISAQYTFLSSLSTLRGLVGLESDDALIQAVLEPQG